LGGSICNVGLLALTNCTFGLNAGRGGDAGPHGGLLAASGGSAEGGAIYNGGYLFAVSCTVASNITVGGESDSFPLDRTGGAYGGGICNTGPRCDLGNCIVAQNSGQQASDLSGVFTSQGFNLITVTNGSTGFGALFDLVGNGTNSLNAALAGLQDAGGATRVFPLLADSPALDAGSSFGVTSDQRGTPRPADLPSLPNSGDGSDIGAFERPN
jgi:hypothetical protein